MIYGGCFGDDMVSLLGKLIVLKKDFLSVQLIKEFLWNAVIYYTYGKGLNTYKLIVKCDKGLFYWWSI